ncbi:MAG TPA: DUF5615 family PIN-like protein [Bacteroidales bacterium]|nr:DUF5615 family PIN-like protein [Bacteroidales bacterium]
MVILADESVDFGIIRLLRKHKISVLSVSEENPGINDSEVIDIAVKNECLLITEDKDFGELTYRLKRQHNGVLLIRLTEMDREERILLVVETIMNHLNELTNNFSVISKKGIRIKPSRLK